MQDRNAEFAVFVDVGVIEGPIKLEFCCLSVEEDDMHGSALYYQVGHKGSFEEISSWLRSSRHSRVSRDL